MAEATVEGSLEPGRAVGRRGVPRRMTVAPPPLMTFPKTLRVGSGHPGMNSKVQTGMPRSLRLGRSRKITQQLNY